MIDQCAHAPLRITAVGPLPPPPGGVASSLKSLLDATQGLEGVELRVIPWHQMWRLPFQRPDVLHLNFSKPAKRMLGTIVGRLCGSAVVHTIHGNCFEFKNILNLFSCKFSNGFILLNPLILEEFKIRGLINSILMTPILKVNRETVSNKESNNIPIEFFNLPYKKTALIYSNNRHKINGYEVYGFEFVSSLLKSLEKMGWKVIFLDPNANFRPEHLFSVTHENAYLHCSPLDFGRLLKSVDLYLRPTSTDGNSVAVLEALALGTPVLASDAVPRPDGVMTYKFGDRVDFLSKMHDMSNSNKRPYSTLLTRVDQYVEFMRRCTRPC